METRANPCRMVRLMRNKVCRSQRVKEQEKELEVRTGWNAGEAEFLYYLYYDFYEKN